MSASLFKFAALAVIGSLLSSGFTPIGCVPLGDDNEAENFEGPVNSPQAAKPPAGADPFALFKSFTDMTSLVSGFGASGAKVLPVLPTEKSKQTATAKESQGFFGIKEPMDFLKFFLNPLELVNTIAKAFNLDGPKFEKSVGRGLDMSMEAALQPPIACIKIIEKVFVPDACMQKFVCEMGKQLAMFKGQMPKFPDSYFEGASTAKALYYGASGRECQHVYDCKEGQVPILKSEFLGLKNKMWGEQESGEGDEKSP